MWAAYDLLVEEVLSQIDPTQADEALEPQLTELMEPRIQKCLGCQRDLLPYYVQHKSSEAETRKPAPAQHPEYDIVFVLRTNPRVRWPLEAKVLKTDGSVGKYIVDLKHNFLTCRYAPFSSQAAMLGYLLSGTAQTALSNIGEKVPCELTPHPDFPDRDHATSDHERTVPEGKDYPKDFRCHHMILPLIQSS